MNNIGYSGTHIFEDGLEISLYLHEVVASFKGASIGRIGIMMPNKSGHGEWLCSLGTDWEIYWYAPSVTEGLRSFENTARSWMEIFA